MPIPENDLPMDEMDDDLELALAAFGDDLRDILNEEEDEGQTDLAENNSHGLTNSVASVALEKSIASQLPAVETMEAVETVLDKYGDKLSGDSKLAYAGSIALACHTASDQTQKTIQRFVIFAIGMQRFALPLSCVVEVVKAGDEITPLPRTAEWLKGITCLRGNILSVTDPAPLFQIPSSAAESDKKMIVISNSQQDVSTAIWVDRIHGIRNLKSEAMQGLDPDDSLAFVFSGIAQQDEHNVLLIDPDQLLSCPELASYLG